MTVVQAKEAEMTKVKGFAEKCKAAFELSVSLLCLRPFISGIEKQV